MIGTGSDPVRTSDRRIDRDAAPCGLDAGSAGVRSLSPRCCGLGLLRRQVAQRTRQLQRELNERRQVEAALRESEARFRDVTEAASDWIWEMDENLRFTYLSERFYALTGIAPQHVLGRTRWELAAVDAPPTRKNGGSIGKCWKSICHSAISSTKPGGEQSRRGPLPESQRQADSRRSEASFWAIAAPAPTSPSRSRRKPRYSKASCGYDASSIWCRT